MDKLYFLTAGVPLRAGTKGYGRGFEIHDEMGLDGLELEFVHGVRISDKSREQVANAVKNSGKIITAHEPFYVNLNAREEDKVEASVQRIIETAQAASDFGGYSITYHAAFYMGMEKEIMLFNEAVEFEKGMNTSNTVFIFTVKNKMKLLKTGLFNGNEKYFIITRRFP